KIPENDLEYYKVEAKKFFKHNRLKAASIEMIKHLAVGEYDEMLQILNEASKDINYDRKIGINFLDALDYVNDFLTREVIPTPFDIINFIYKGGFGRKELSIFVGATSAGKSWLLQMLAIHAYLEGYNVVYYSLEMSDISVMQRLCQIVLKKPVEKLSDDDIKNIKQVVKDRGCTGNLYITEYPTGTASTLTIENNLKQLYNIHGFTPDLIVVDYADLIKPLIRYKDDNKEIGKIYEELRAIASKTNTSMISAAQVNRNGYGKSRVTIKDLAGSFNRAFICDNVVTIGRNDDDREAGGGLAFINKNRMGLDSIEIPLTYNLDSGEIVFKNIYGDEVNSNVKYKKMILKGKENKQKIEDSLESMVEIENTSEKLEIVDEKIDNDDYLNELDDYLNNNS
ncbi:TPA: AAA family ATPase, partial [Candidatus Woesearchaeota archaeon]|nr:AAA family ATPase [Candidatus Woesearchaeota archaeon]